MFCVYERSGLRQRMVWESFATAKNKKTKNIHICNERKNIIFFLTKANVNICKYSKHYRQWSRFFHIFRLDFDLCDFCCWVRHDTDKGMQKCPQFKKSLLLFAYEDIRVRAVHSILDYFIFCKCTANSPNSLLLS